MKAVKQETNVEFLVLRAWKTAQWRKELGLPQNPEQLAILVKYGTPSDPSKSASFDNVSEPSAA